MSVYKLSLAAFSLAGLVTAAQAADLPQRNAPPVFTPPPHVFSWTGFYVGANAGYSFGNNGKSVTTGTPGFLALGGAEIPGSLNTRSSGFAGGGQIGYNYQTGPYVLGVEGDIDYVDQKKTASFTGAGTALGTPITTSFSKKLDYLGTVRGRVGYAFDRFLVYGTGGLAFGDVKTSAAVTTPTGFAWSGSKSDTRVGYAIGGGVEYAFTDNISLRGEYLYYDLGRQRINTTGNAAVQAASALNGVSYSAKTRTEGSLVRAAINYKF